MMGFESLINQVSQLIICKFDVSCISLLKSETIGVHVKMSCVPDGYTFTDIPLDTTLVMVFHRVVHRGHHLYQLFNNLYSSYLSLQ